jgi:hypothetical protein
MRWTDTKIGPEANKTSQPRANATQVTSRRQIPVFERPTASHDGASFSLVLPRRHTPVCGHLAMRASQRARCVSNLAFGVHAESGLSHRDLPMWFISPLTERMRSNPLRADAGTVPARQETNIGKQSIDRIWSRGNLHRGARDRVHLSAHCCLMPPGDRSDGR